MLPVRWEDVNTKGAGPDTRVGQMASGKSRDAEGLETGSLGEVTGEPRSVHDPVSPRSRHAVHPPPAASTARGSGDLLPGPSPSHQAVCAGHRVPRGDRHRTRCGSQNSPGALATLLLRSRWGKMDCTRIHGEGPAAPPIPSAAPELSLCGQQVAAPPHHCPGVLVAG